MRLIKFAALTLVLQLSLGYLMFAGYLLFSKGCSFDGPLGYVCNGDFGNSLFWIVGFIYLVIPPVIAKVLSDWRKWNLNWLKIVSVHIIMVALTFISLFIYVHFYLNSTPYDYMP